MTSRTFRVERKTYYIMCKYENQNECFAYRVANCGWGSGERFTAYPFIPF